PDPAVARVTELSARELDAVIIVIAHAMKIRSHQTMPGRGCRKPLPLQPQLAIGETRGNINAVDVACPQHLRQPPAIGGIIPRGKALDLIAALLRSLRRAQ